MIIKHFKTDLSETRRTIRKATFDKKDSASRIMLVGFDTEYQQVSETENEVLSYQYAAAVLSDDQSVASMESIACVSCRPGGREGRHR